MQEQVTLASLDWEGKLNPGYEAWYSPNMVAPCMGAAAVVAALTHVLAARAKYLS